MNFHICSSCHLLFWKAQCVLKVNWGCSKRTQRKVADVHFWMEGGRGGIAERRGRRGPLLQGSTQGYSKIPKMFGTSMEELAIDRPSFCLAMVFFFSFCFLFHWLYDVKMLFLSHVSCLVCMSSWCESVDVCVCKVFYPCAGDIMHGVLGCLRESVCVCVCAYMFLLLGQCFVFIALLTHLDLRINRLNWNPFLRTIFCFFPLGEAWDSSWMFLAPKLLEHVSVAASSGAFPSSNQSNILLQVPIQFQLKVQLFCLFP